MERDERQLERPGGMVRQELMPWTKMFASAYAILVFFVIGVKARVTECDVTQVEVEVQNSTFSITYHLSLSDPSTCTATKNWIGQLVPCTNTTDLEICVDCHLVGLPTWSGEMAVERTGSYKLSILGDVTVSSNCFSVLGQVINDLAFAVDYRTNGLNAIMEPDVRVSKVVLHVFKAHETDSILCSDENDLKFRMIRRMESDQGAFHLMGPFNANDCLCFKFDLVGVAERQLLYDSRIPRIANCLKPVSVEKEGPAVTRFVPAEHDQMLVSLVVNQLAILKALEQDCGPTTPGSTSVSQILDGVRELSRGLTQVKESLADLAVSHTVPTCPVSNTSATQLITEACVVDGRTYQEGDYYVDNNCTITVCQQGQLAPYQGSAPMVDIYKLLANNCVYIVEHAWSWVRARANCVANGGDLYVPGDFEGMGHYLHGRYDSGAVWVGLKSRLWIDGRYVTHSEWKAGQPDGDPDQCGYLDPATEKLQDYSCHTGYVFLCHKGVYYS